MYYIFIVIPAITRTDGGTENVLLAACQMFLRRNHEDSLAAEKSHMYGTSMANQVSKIKLTTDRKLARECYYVITFSLQYL